MRTKSEDEMRTALRQAGAIAAVDGQYSIRLMPGLSRSLYDAMLLLHFEEPARRIRPTDAVFTPSAAPRLGAHDEVLVDVPGSGVSPSTRQGA